MTARAADTENTTTSPWWNGPEMSSGKNTRPVRTCRDATGKVASTPFADNRCCKGFTPSTAANKDETGGRAPISCATLPGTLLLMRPCVSVCGSVLASPAIMRLKNTPIDSAVPEF